MPFQQSVAHELIVPFLIGISAGIILIILAEIIFRISRHKWWWYSGIFFACILLCVAIEYVTSPKQVQEPSNLVAGTVFETSSGRVIEGASVTVVNRAESDTTDSTGHFHILLNQSAPVPDFLRLRATAQGYAEAVQPVTPPDHDVVIQLRRIEK
jgi:Carboxypeptidase regulatory-like domain